MDKRVLVNSLMVLPMMMLGAQCMGQDQASLAATDYEVVFTIGKQNGSDGEFRSSGWRGTEEYTFRVGVDTDDRFPAELHVRGAYVSYGVSRLTVVFVAKKSYERAVLRLVRGGNETSVVTVDGTREYTITSAMLGSAEGFRAGSYDLDIGSIEEGEHSLVFTVLQDGRGNGTYQWDALTLLGIATEM